MGQCYTVYLKVQFNNEEGAIKALRDKIANGGKKDVDDIAREEKLDLNTIDGLLRHYYGNGEDNHKWTEGYPDPEWLCGDFNATYSWESVMMEAFEAMAPYLKNGSEIKIYPDSGVDHAVIKKGKVKWLS